MPAPAAICEWHTPCAEFDPSRSGLPKIAEPATGPLAQNRRDRGLLLTPAEQG